MKKVRVWGGEGCEAVSVLLDEAKKVGWEVEQLVSGSTRLLFDFGQGWRDVKGFATLQDILIFGREAP